MGYKLIPPGTRHGNKVYYALISIKGKRPREISTGTGNKKLADDYARKAEERFHRHENRERTVGEMIDAYLNFRRPGVRQEGYCLALLEVLGNRHDVRQADFDEAARVLYPGRSNATWNRCVYTPLQAVLKHNGIVIALRRPKVPRSKYKALTAAQRDILMANAEGEFKTFLTVLFYCGRRISEAVSLTWDRVDLKNQVACFEQTKTDTDHWQPLHPTVVIALANIEHRVGKVFTYKSRHHVRPMLKRLFKATKIKFHPHMARHTFADLLVEKGASMRDLMDAGGWKDQTSAMRYTSRRVERVRKAIESL